MEEKDFNALVAKMEEATGKKITEQMKEALKGLDIEILKTLNAESFASKEVVEGLKTTLQTMKEEIATLKEMGENSKTAEKGSFVQFVEKNIEGKPSDTPNYKAQTQIDAKALLESTVEKAPALMTTANVVPNVSNGFNQLFGNFVDSTIYSVPKPETFILPLIDVTVQPGTESIWYVDRANQEGDAAFIGEGDAKPLADAEWLEKKAPVKEVALFWKFSKRLSQNAPSVVTDFRQHANELIEQKIDDGVFTGDNLGNNLNGVTEVAVPFVVPTQLALYYQNANIFDAVMAAATKIRLGNHKGTITAVLNTVWKAIMFGVKAEDNSAMYIMPPFVAPDGSKISDVNVVFTNKADADILTIGVLKNFKAVISQNIEYYEGYENDDFRKNLMSKKLEAFMGTYIPASMAGSIISDDIATILTAIEAV
jgi:hypothetical protein